jgi:hypothetical protein
MTLSIKAHTGACRTAARKLKRTRPTVHALASFLREHGAEAVSIGALDHVQTRDNPLHAKRAAELARPAKP